MIPNERRMFSIGSWIQTAILVALAGVATTAAPSTRAAESAAPKSSVRLIIDYGDGVQKHFTQITHKTDMTVWNVLQAAEQHPRGIQIKSRGKEDTLLVTEIDGQANEGGTSSRNWIFRVNENLGEQSAGIAPVKAGDVIQWRYERYDE